MSMVRLLVYANQLDIEGLIATTSTWMRATVRPDVLHKVIAAYGEVRAAARGAGARLPDGRRARRAGREGPGGLRHGARSAPTGSRPAPRRSSRPSIDADARPLWVLGWGGTNTLAQALFHVRRTRKPADLEAFVAKLRVYAISDQDDAGPWLRRVFQNLHYIAHAVVAGRRGVLPRDVDRHQRRSLLPQRARRRLHDLLRTPGSRPTSAATARSARSTSRPAASTRATRRRSSA